MTKTITTPMFIFEMANNHMGDVNHGIRIVNEFKAVAKDFNYHFSIKLQHRDSTFFHPDHIRRVDHKYIKRFTETMLSRDDFKRLKDAIQDAGFISMCTPWDEASVDLMDELGFDIIKIASCSFTDWTLLERVVKSKQPVIASTAGAKLEDIDRVVSFLAHRNKSFSIMHCVGEYPCLKKNLELNQIDLFLKRYPNIPIGFSTHEDPQNFDTIGIAIAKGATLFEKHVGVATDKYKLNAYSANSQQARQWLQAAQDAYEMCGVSNRRRDITAKEMSDIVPLFRGAFAAKDIAQGSKLSAQDMFLAMPNIDGQVVASDLSKYTTFTSQAPIKKNAPIMQKDVSRIENRAQVTVIVDRLKKMLKDNRIAMPPYVDIEVSHHYGIENFEKTGAILIYLINRSYSKMLVVMFPGQSYPRHHHIQKDESYHVLYGDMTVEMNGVEHELKAGSVISINQKTPHSFKTRGGVIVEEIATTYFVGDSIYEDESINENKRRKTQLTFWPDWMCD